MPHQNACTQVLTTPVERHLGRQQRMPQILGFLPRRETQTDFPPLSSGLAQFFALQEFWSDKE